MSGFRKHPAPAQVLSSSFPLDNGGLWILDELAVTVHEEFYSSTEKLKQNTMPEA